MRILMTADTVGGVWTFAVDLARSLGTGGSEVYLATMGAPMTSSQRNEIRALRNVEVTESSYRLEWMTDPWNEVDRAGEWLLGLKEQFRPNVVHLNGYSHAALPWDVPVVVTGHSCVCSWWRAVRGQEAPASCDEYRRRVREALASANLVVTPSQAMLDELRSIYGFVGAGVVIPNARHSEQFYGAPKDKLIMSAGRAWDAAKNISALDAVAPKLEWPIEVAGDCAHPNGSSVRLRNVHCLGRLDPPNLAAKLARAAIFALPARYEPFGLSILEAGLSGCALVLGDIPSLREIWGNTVVFVNPNDYDRLGRLLNELTHDHWHRAGLSHRAKVRALEIASRDIGQAYLNAYQACLQPEEVAA